MVCPTKATSQGWGSFESQQIAFCMMVAARDGHHRAGPMPPAIAAAALVLASFAAQHLGAAANSSLLAQAAEIFAKKAKRKALQSHLAMFSALANSSMKGCAKVCT